MRNAGPTECSKCGQAKDTSDTCEQCLPLEPDVYDYSWDNRWLMDIEGMPE